MMLLGEVERTSFKGIFVLYEIPNQYERFKEQTDKTRI